MLFKMLLVLLVLTSALGFSNAYPGTHPPDKELQYRYHALMRIGTNEPVTYASQVAIDAILHLRTEAKHTIATLNNIKFKLYNGELDFTSEYKSKPLSLPSEAHELENTFQIKYDSSGKALCIITDDGESEFSRNFKKAIASILQLDITSINIESSSPHAFITQENNIYGTTLVDYNVIPEKSGKFIVTKQNEVKTSKSWYKYFNINAETLRGPPLVSPLTVDSHRKYELVKIDGGFQITHIESRGDVFIHPTQGMAERNYVSVSQILDLIAGGTSKRTYPPPPPPPVDECKDDLTFVYEVETDSGAMGDMTLGRRPVSEEQIIAEVCDDLQEMVTFLQEYQLTVQAPDVWRGQTINRLQRRLSQLGVPALHTLHKKLCEDTSAVGKLKLDIFYQIIPLVGTRASIVFIKELICTKQIFDSVAIDILKRMPFHVRMPSERLLNEVEELINIPKPVNVSVQNAAILSFATLIHKVFVDRPLFEENHSNWNYNSEELQRRFGRSDVLEKYILKFMDKLKQASDYPTKYLYIQALYNIQVGNVAKYLEPYVKCEKPECDHNLQKLAIYASLPGQIQQPDHAYTLFWPIFTDRKLHLEVRIAAYNVLMATKLTMSKLWNIYWYMQCEPNPELYHFFYTNIISLATSNNPLTSDSREYAKQVVKFLLKPMKPYLSGSYVNDYIDAKYGAGAMLQYNIQSTKTSKLFYFDLINNVFGIPFRYYSAYIKIDGLDESELAKPSDEKHSELYELQRILQVISELHNKKEITLEYSILKYGQVYEYGIYDEHNISGLIEIIKNIFTKGDKWLETYIAIDYVMMKDIVMPNDLGFLTYVQIKTPNLINSKANVISDMNNNIITMNGDYALQHAIRSTYDTSVYNPISDTWHGFHRIRSYDFIMPINFQLSLNFKQFAFKWALRCHEETEKNTMGVRSHVTIQTYVSGDRKGYLGQSNSLCNPYMNVTAGDRYRVTYDLLNADDENTGFHYKVAVFDSEQQLYHKSFLELLEESLYNVEGIYTNADTAKLITLGQNLFLHTVLYPGVGISGFLATAASSENQKVSQLDFSLRLNQEGNREDGTHLPSTKINLRATYTIKAHEKSLRTWDVTGGLSMHAGHIENLLKLQIARIIPGQNEYRICSDVHKNWNSSGTVGKMVILAGESADGKCPRDGASIEINMIGELSDRQYQINNREYRKYEDCFQTNLYEPNMKEIHIKNYNVLKCTEKYLSLRKYNFDVKYNKIPDYFTKILKLLLEVVQATMVPHSWHQHQTYTYLAALNSMNVEVEYPVHGHELQLNVVNEQDSSNLTGISTRDLEYIGFYADNYQYSYKYQWLYRFGLTKTCLTNEERVFSSSYSLSYPFCDGCEWVQLASDTANHTFSVEVQKKTSSNPLNLRVKFKNDILLIKPNLSEYDITLNGKPLPRKNKYYYYDSWFSYTVLPDMANTATLAIYKYGLYIDFNGHIIKMDAPLIGSDLIGECFS